MINIPGSTVLRLSNPYAAIAYGQIAERSINPPGAIYAAVNRLMWLPKFGPPYAVLSSDTSVEKVELERPWMLLTAWRLGLDGPVTSVEGAKSVLEHRTFMRNPLTKVSVAMPRPELTTAVFATVKTALDIAAEVLRRLGMLYAGVPPG
ncbi:hypothetical protein Pogu_1392 [Pyrobaculum oguniense TE7]|uniref:Uncharacterized protein n=1 Tax=Pyrobaculum oguniense (strain DSM 13380 / JCM 10595 / TE7) TaxID=698757 RepID=H6Q938_PYROT|nr:hypothetical protein Pogu_1392 [Pyrobaculum oguniense TE7]